jgi:hypothetical protein
MGVLVVAVNYDHTMTCDRDLALIAAAPLVTTRYQSFRPGDGVPIRSTVGEPKFWRHGPLVFVRQLAPWGLLSRSMSDADAQRIYVERLDRDANTIVAALAEIARQHPDRPLVVLCFEDVHAGQVCHRRWFADWFRDRYGTDVSELEPAGSVPADPTLFDVRS